MPEDRARFLSEQEGASPWVDGASRLSESPAAPPRLAVSVWDRYADRPGEMAGRLREAGALYVSRRSLSGMGAGMASSARALHAMKAGGWLSATRTRGVWQVRTAPAGSASAAGSRAEAPPPSLAAHLVANPGSKMTLGPHMLPEHEGWTARSFAARWSLPPREAVPAAFSEPMRQGLVVRWAAQAPPLWAGGLVPVWRYDTEIVFMAARPGRYPLDEMHDYLWELAHASTAENLLAELEGRPRSVWMRTCLLLRYGCRRGLADVLLAAAPSGKGPYFFAPRCSDPARRASLRRRHAPIWHPDLELLDFTVDAHLGVRTARYGPNTLPAWAWIAYESGRPAGHPAPLACGYPPIAEIREDNRHAQA